MSARQAYWHGRVHVSRTLVAVDGPVCLAMHSSLIHTIRLQDFREDPEIRRTGPYAGNLD
jgi:hypothetical protein